jgi:hypothetical protein
MLRDVASRKNGACHVRHAKALMGAGLRRFVALSRGIAHFLKLCPLLGRLVAIPLGL